MMASLEPKGLHQNIATSRLELDSCRSFTLQRANSATASNPLHSSCLLMSTIPSWAQQLRKFRQSQHPGRWAGLVTWSFSDVAFIHDDMVDVYIPMIPRDHKRVAARNNMDGKPISINVVLLHNEIYLTATQLLSGDHGWSSKWCAPRCGSESL